MADHLNGKAKTADTAQIALKCAEFFMSLGQSCLEFYHKYNREKQRKTKTIKKAPKQSNNRANRKNDNDAAEDGDDDYLKRLPKKPLTAYIIYFQEKKPNFVQKHPGLNLSDLTKLIAKQWKQIDENLPQEDRKRYENQMKEFKKKYGTAVNPEEDQDVLEEQNLIENEMAEIQNEADEDVRHSEKMGMDEENNEGEGEGEGEDEENQKDNDGDEGENEGDNQNEGDGEGNDSSDKEEAGAGND